MTGPAQAGETGGGAAPGGPPPFAAGAAGVGYAQGGNPAMGQGAAMGSADAAGAQAGPMGGAGTAPGQVPPPQWGAGAWMPYPSAGGGAPGMSGTASGHPAHAGYAGMHHAPYASMYHAPYAGVMPPHDMAYAATPLGFGPGIPAGMAMPHGLGHQGPGPARGAGMAEMIQEMANGGGGLSSLSKLLNFEDSEFWKGALVGAAAVLLLTNESVQNALFKTGVKAKDAVERGVEKVKEAAGVAKEAGHE